jgi:maltooligosyltrehalose trehalohydrolase
MIHNTETRTLGLNFTSADSADVLIWAPYAGSVSINIHNGSIIPLEKKEIGYWKSEGVDIRAGEKYKITIDDKTFPDPASLFQPDGVHSFSQAVNLRSFKWSDNDWQGVLPEDFIIYELHTGTFTSSGSFDAIAEKLKYLKHLGITAIELMPVGQFPGSRNWGYDAVFPFAVQNSYGGPEGLQKLVDNCHKEDIAVILDVVYNHLGPEGNYLEAFGPYFTEKYKTPWGKAINFDDEWCDGVRKYFIENALMWFRDFHIDALRLDAIHAIRDFGAKHILEELMENVKELNKINGRNHLLIAESDLNDVRCINPQGMGGYGLDMQWCDEFHHAIHALVTKEQYGYYSDFGSITHLGMSFNDAFVYNGIYSSTRKRTYGSDTTGQPGFKFIVFTQNHDQIGNRLHGERLSTLVDHETLKLLAGAVFLSPYVPLIFMGEEYSETNPFLYFTSHGDEELIRAVREGRQKEFSFFADQSDPYDPQSIETFNKSKLQWENHSEKQAKMFAFYRELIRLRKNHPVLKSTDREGVQVVILKNSDTIILLREHGDNMVICLINFEEVPVPVELKAQKRPLIVLIDSSAPSIGNLQNITLENEDINLNARSFLVLSNIKV